MKKDLDEDLSCKDEGFKIENKDNSKRIGESEKKNKRKMTSTQVGLIFSIILIIAFVCGHVIINYIVPKLFNSVDAYIIIMTCLFIAGGIVVIGGIISLFVGLFYLIKVQNDMIW